MDVLAKSAPFFYNVFDKIQDKIFSNECIKCLRVGEGAMNYYFRGRIKDQTPLVLVDPKFNFLYSVLE